MGQVVNQAAFIRAARDARRRGRRVVFTNGVFDLLHFGHVAYLQKARRLGDALFIGVNTDASVRRLKGPSRPLVPLSDRMHVLAALECVDRVTSFGEDTPQELIEQLRPAILVKGADYRQKDIVGAESVKSKGGRVVRIPLARGRSTSNLVAKIKRS